MRMPRQAVISLTERVGRIAIGGVLIYASVTKFTQPYSFLDSVYSYDLVGPRAGVLIAATLPTAELAVGLAVIFGIAAPGALLAAAVLFSAFSFAIASALWRGLDIACGCFSSQEVLRHPIGYATLLRTLALLSGSIALAVLASLRDGHPTCIRDKQQHREC